MERTGANVSAVGAVSASPFRRRRQLTGIVQHVSRQLFRLLHLLHLLQPAGDEMPVRSACSRCSKRGEGKRGPICHPDMVFESIFPVGFGKEAKLRP